MARPRARRIRAATAAVVLAAALAAAGAAPAAAAEDEPRALDVVGRASAEQAAGRPAALFVEFERPSALREYREQLIKGRDVARRAARDARAVITRFTDELLAGFRGADGAGEIFRTSNAVPGVAVRANSRIARELARRPGVRSVRRITPARTSNSGADELGGAVRAWQQTGRLGAGVRIGVIDTGIDYTHADLGGPGTKQAFEANDRARVDRDSFPTAKVVGGIDLAGDDYDADSSDPGRATPNPDDNPLDCQSHGTHVAATAAGYGVTAEGATFRGHHETLTRDAVDRMRIGPGAAPGASLYAIRVFGCSGSTTLTAQGLDRALDPNGDGDFDDRLDVVNLSLGAAFGAVDDPVNDFVHALTENGVLVVAAAGNTGDVYDAGGPPGNSPDALAVASVRDAAVLLDGIEAQSPTLQARSVAGQYSTEYAGYDMLDVTGPVVELGGRNTEGCDPYDPADTTRARGAVVWLAWPDDKSARACASQRRAERAAAAGAVGVLLTSGKADFGSSQVGGNAGIPVFQLSGPATEALRPALAAGGLRVRLAGALRETQQVSAPAIEDTLSEFSARGVRAPTVKPDVAAPGESITSAESGSGNGREKHSGTSMASPFVAGVAALVREAHPDWSPAQVKAAIMGTATADVYTGDGHTGSRYAPMRVGAGRVDARAALATTLLAADAQQPGAVSVTFGTVEVPPGAPLVRRKQVRVTTTSPRPVTLDVGYQYATAMPGARIEVSPARVVVAPGSGAIVDVTLRIDDPAALRRTADPTLKLTQAGARRQHLADSSGRIVLTRQDGSGTIRIPVSAAPKPVSTLAADLAGDALRLTGTGVNQGTGGEAYRSRMGVFALAASSPEMPICAKDDEPAADCVANRTGRGGDLRYVGVATTGGPQESALLGVAITTWADLPGIGTLTCPIVEIDGDGDGEPDFATSLSTRPETDVLVATTMDLRARATEVDVQPVNGFEGSTDTNVFDTNAWVLPIRLAALGVGSPADAAALRLRVHVVGEYGSPTGNGLVDSTGWTPRLDRITEGRPVPGLLMPADGGSMLPVDPAGPMLVVLNQNPTGRRVAVLGSTREPLRTGG